MENITIASLEAKLQLLTQQQSMFAGFNESVWQDLETQIISIQSEIDYLTLDESWQDNCTSAELAASF